MTTKKDTAIDRRRLLTRGAVAAGVAALWPAAKGFAHQDRPRGRRWGGPLVLEVACLGNTFAPNLAGALDAAGGDLHGATFNVEGRIYRPGTIPAGDGFDPESAEAIGAWLCRGFFLLNPAREFPHVHTIQEYFLEPLEANPAPGHGLISNGLEGGLERVDRAIIGGTGWYMGAQGQVEQLTIGTNTTILNEFNEAAPNFRFSFWLNRGYHRVP